MMSAMIIQKSDDSDNFFVSLANLSLDQMVTNQVADGFRAILITLTADASVKCVQQVVLKRDAETGDDRHNITAETDVARF
jgi:hypothetical protein